MILYLTGPSGAGKSSVGGLLAEKAGQRFVDLDRVIENHAGKTITAIFMENGEHTFRDMERELLRKCSEQNDTVIAAGGGAVLDERNRRFMRGRGKVILLAASPRVLLERVGDGDVRPLLGSNREKVLYKMLFERAAAYCDADGFLDTTNLSAEKAAEILAGRFYEK